MPAATAMEAMRPPKDLPPRPDGFDLGAGDRDLHGRPPGGDRRGCAVGNAPAGLPVRKIEPQGRHPLVVQRLREADEERVVEARAGSGRHDERGEGVGRPGERARNRRLPDVDADVL